MNFKIIFRKGGAVKIYESTKSFSAYKIANIIDYLSNLIKFYNFIILQHHFLKFIINKS